jgi:hypothetical protein
VSSLILYNGSLLKSGGALVMTGANPPDPACCCPPHECGCCDGDLPNPIPNVFLSFSGDCAVLNALTVELVIDAPNPEPPNRISGDNCWRGEYAGGECFGTLFSLCCDVIDGVQYMILTAEATTADGCVLDDTSKVLASCSCDPFEFVFTFTVKDAGVPGVCVCCAPGSTVTVTATF